MRLVLCGSSRSGTTITARLLNQHPEIKITNEGRAFLSSCVSKPTAREYFEEIQQHWNRTEHAYRMPPEGFDSNNIVETGMSFLKEDTLDGRTQAYCDMINLQNWKYTGDKGADPDVLCQLADEKVKFKLIWIHRDGRDVAHSGVRLGKVGREPPFSKSFSENLQYWAERVLHFLDNIMKFTEVDYNIIRFEDYQYPGAIGERLNKFLGVDGLDEIEKRLIRQNKIKHGYGVAAHPDWKDHASDEAMRALHLLGYM